MVATTVEDVKALVAEQGIGFFLCSFVEMSGAPKAKLVPATHLDDMAAGSAGFAGFAAGEIGQGPHDPDMIAHPRLQLADGRALAQEHRLGGEQHPGQRRSLALLPAHHLAAPAREGHPARVRRQRRRRARVHAPQARRAGWLRPVGRPGYAGQAVLRPARAAPQPGRLDDAHHVRPGAGLGPLRERPRGRQLPVRAQLPLRRRADDGRPPHLLQVDGQDRGRAARAAGHVHAEAFRPPHRQRRALPPEPVGPRQRDEPVPRRAG